MILDARATIDLTVLVAATLSATTTVYAVSPPYPCIATDVVVGCSDGSANHTDAAYYTIQVTAQPANTAIYSANSAAGIRTNTAMVLAAATPRSIGTPDQNTRIAANSMLAISFTKTSTADNLLDVYATVRLKPA